MISLGYEIRYDPGVAVRHKSSKEHRIDWANGRFYYNVRNMLYLTRKHFRDSVLLSTYIAGYLFKGLRNGLPKAAINGVWDGLRMDHGLKGQAPLGKAARDYIDQYEYAPRGTAWKRFMKEVILPLTGSRSK